ECLARAALTAALTADGLDVARPERDAGIDLLAYTINPLRVALIQMKAATVDGLVDRPEVRAGRRPRDGLRLERPLLGGRGVLRDDLPGRLRCRWRGRLAV